MNTSYNDAFNELKRISAEANELINFTEKISVQMDILSKQLTNLSGNKTHENSTSFKTSVKKVEELRGLMDDLHLKMQNHDFNLTKLIYRFPKHWEAIVTTTANTKTTTLSTAVKPPDSSTTGIITSKVTAPPTLTAITSKTTTAKTTIATIPTTTIAPSTAAPTTASLTSPNAVLVLSTTHNSNKPMIISFDGKF